VTFPTTSTYPNLLSPLELGFTTLRNRVVMFYAEAITGQPVGKKVAVVGAGGIGFDVSEFLVTESSTTLNLKEWKTEWGAADPWETRGALTTPIPASPARVNGRKAPPCGRARPTGPQ
jgi:hypothetical protein